MFFEDNIPDPHMGVYSETVLGRSGEIQPLGFGSPPWLSNGWFVGYYLKGPYNSNTSLTEHMLFNNIEAGYTSDPFFVLVSFDIERDTTGWLFLLYAGWYYIYIPTKFNNIKDGLWFWSENLHNYRNVIGLSSAWQWHNRYWCIQNYIFAYDGLNIANFTTSNLEYWLKQALSLNKIEYTEPDDPYIYSDRMCFSNNVSTGDGVLFWVNKDTYGSNYMLMRPYIKYNNNTGEIDTTTAYPHGYYYFYKTNSFPYYAYFKT